MEDINYICQRLEEIYRAYFDSVTTTVEKREKTYTLILNLKGVNYYRFEYEIDKNIESIGQIINYICKDVESRYRYE